MTGGFVSKRRADDFDALLSSASTRDDAVAEEYGELLELVGALRSVPEVHARPEFVADLRSQLVAAAAEQPARVVDDATAARLTPRQHRSSRERRLATVLGGFAVVAATGSMAMASQGALPGDTLYPIKRAIENARTNLQSDDAARAETLLAHAEQRLREAEALSARDGDHSAEISRALQDFSEQTDQATELALDDYTENGDAAPVDRLREFTDSSMVRLEGLGDRIPRDARPALITAAQTVRNADTAAIQLCPTCGEGGVAQLPEFAANALVLPDTILGLDTTAETTAGPSQALLKEAQRLARHTPLQPPPPADQGSTDESDPVTDPGTQQIWPTAPDPGTDPVIDPEPATDPLNQLGNEIKKQLGEDSETGKVVGEITGPLISGVNGLVDGLLGN
jgi:hypothetical protein